MARPERNTVDYFPFICDEGKKMFYIEQVYGNDGFAVFIKILRELAKTEYHFLDLSNDTTMMFLSAKCKVNVKILEAIINDLVKLEKFDNELWSENKIIWCQDFIDTIQDAYKKRNNECITKNSLIELLQAKGTLKQYKSNPKQPKKPTKEPVNPQRKEKKIKEKEIKENNICKQKSLHSILREDFEKWYFYLKKIQYYWKAKDAKALHQTISQLKFSIRSEKMEDSDEHIRAAFRNILKSNRDKWITDNLSMSIINSKYNEIIAKIKSSPENLRQRIIREMQAELDKSK